MAVTLWSNSNWTEVLHRSMWPVRKIGSRFAPVLSCVPLCFREMVSAQMRNMIRRNSFKCVEFCEPRFIGCVLKQNQANLLF